eukprot:1161766-Pelagomonas_calceolata.AAC.5
MKAEWLLMRNEKREHREGIRWGCCQRAMEMVWRTSANMVTYKAASDSSDKVEGGFSAIQAKHTM